MGRRLAFLFRKLSLCMPQTQVSGHFTLRTHSQCSSAGPDALDTRSLVPAANQTTNRRSSNPQASHDTAVIPIARKLYTPVFPIKHYNNVL
jgi:hypothetical protein